jgi:hypothetical protein
MLASTNLAWLVVTNIPCGHKLVATNITHLCQLVTTNIAMNTKVLWTI